MSEVDHASNWDRLIFALELAVNSKINMELTTSQCKYLLDKLTSLTDRIADLEAERRWIPVSERLPEVGEFVLVFIGEVPFQNEPINIIERTAYDGGRFVDFMCEYATHWMPLPPPPEEK